MADRESQIVLGLDPDPAALWRPSGSDRRSGSGRDGTPQQRAAAAVAAHCKALIDAAGVACVAVKVQLACFERLGAPGRQALDAVLADARDAGLLVIVDGKRGDIDVTAEAYAQSLFGGLKTPYGTIDGMDADMATVNPLMGEDAIAPFVCAARQRGAGVLLLVRTSNPGAADLEDLRLEEGGTVWERSAKIVERLGSTATAGALSDVGAVMGATEPSHLERARELMPRAVFLLPGVGAQGGRIEALRPAFSTDRAAALVSVSRSIALAHLQRRESPPKAARVAAERLRAAAWELSATL